MNPINFKTEIDGTIEEGVQRISQALQKEGFGILTRVDLHVKIKEKIGKDLASTVILGACQPNLAFEAMRINSDIASLLPCNAVVREIAPGRISIELAKPSAMMEMIGDETLVTLARQADQSLRRALDSL